MAVGQSQRLRLDDVRQALRLVGDCRDLGHDPDAWLGRAAAGLGPLCGAGPVLTFLLPPGGFRDSHAVRSFQDAGWDRPAHRAVCLEYTQANQFQQDASFQRFRRRKTGKAALTQRRGQLVADRDYYASAYFNEARRPLWLDDSLVSEAGRPGEPAATLLVLHRPLGSQFTPRDARRLHLFHVELAELIGRRLAAGPGGLAADLPPRLRRVLARLLDGDGEKQAALRLGLSRHTVHEYVTLLYRRYDVQSRAELLALFLRHGRPLGV